LEEFSQVVIILARWQKGFWALKKDHMRGEDIGNLKGALPREPNLFSG
jgi:hypothetical protein